MAQPVDSELESEGAGEQDELLLREAGRHQDGGEQHRPGQSVAHPHQQGREHEGHLQRLGERGRGAEEQAGAGRDHQPDPRRPAHLVGQSAGEPGGGGHGRQAEEPEHLRQPLGVAEAEQAGHPPEEGVTVAVAGQVDQVVGGAAGERVDGHRPVVDAVIGFPGDGEGERGIELPDVAGDRSRRGHVEEQGEPEVRPVRHPLVDGSGDDREHGAHCRDDPCTHDRLLVGPEERRRGGIGGAHGQ